MERTQSETGHINPSVPIKRPHQNYKKHFIAATCAAYDETIIKTK